MDAATLQRAVPGISRARAKELTPGLNQAMRLAECTTPDRCAMFLAEWRQESVNFIYTQEIGSDAYLRSKPYWPYIGRTFGQLTWDFNYRAFGHWLHENGELDDPEFFVKNPTALADVKYAFDGPAWFWLTHGLNDFADRGDIQGASRRINGGDNGMAQRIANWNHIRPLGAALLPEGDALTPEDRKWIENLVETRDVQLARALVYGGSRGPLTRLKYRFVRAKGKGIIAVLQRDVAALKRDVSNLKKGK
jgi:predicted chitinase